MELKRLKYFVTAAHELSFSGAARRLGVSQPVLSRGIKELETFVGAELFNRSTTEISLTKAGEVFLPKADEALLTLDEALLSVREVERGRDSLLDVAYVPVGMDIFIGPALESLRQTIPSMCLRPHEMNSQRQLDALKAGKIDIAIIGHNNEQALTTDFDIFDIHKVKLAFALPSVDPLANRVAIDIEDLQEHDLVSFKPEELPHCEGCIRGHYTRKKFPYEPLMLASSFQNAITAVVMGNGYAVVPLVGRTVASHLISFIPSSDDDFTIQFSAIVRKDENRRIVLAFLQECRRIAETRVPTIEKKASAQHVAATQKHLNA